MNITEQFRLAIAEFGIPAPAVIIPDGKLHRFSTNDRPDDDAGWYVLFADGIAAGAFGDWRTGKKGSWCAVGEHTLTAAERSQHRARMEAIQRGREEDKRQHQAEAAQRASFIWTSGSPVKADHPYLVRKRVMPIGIRQYESKLLIPLRDEAGVLRSLQFIGVDGDKEFLFGGRVKACFHLMGEVHHTVCVTEGYATAASIHEATGLPVATAFFAANLLPVARAIRARHRQVRIVLCGDHDENGVGQMKAKEAADAVSATVLIPEQPGTDWNDMHVEHGLDAVRTIVTAVLEHQEEKENARLDPMPFTKLGALLAEPQEHTAFLLEGRLPSGGLSLLAGKPKAGKTTWARALALCVARGTPFLGFPTSQGPVLYLALEEKRAEVRRHFAQMGATDEDILVFCSPSPADGLPLLRKAADSHKPVLIIVDPLFKLVRIKDGNDYAQVTTALEPLLTLARETGAHVLAVHHLGKGERDGGDAILGSTAIFAAVDTVLLLKRTDKYRTISSIQRYGPDMEEMTVTLNPDTHVVEVGPSRGKADEDAAIAMILEFLKSNDHPVTEAVIDEGMECRRALWKKALRTLVADGRVLRSGKGGKADPFRYAHSSGGNPGTRIPNDLEQASRHEHQDCGSEVSDIHKEPGNLNDKPDAGPHQCTDYFSSVTTALFDSGPPEQREVIDLDTD